MLESDKSKCMRCGHEWVPHNHGDPKCCPKCLTKHYKEPHKNPLKCSHCNHEWTPLVDEPKYCPRCKSIRKIAKCKTIYVSNLTLERVLRRREPYSEPVYSVIERLLNTSNTNPVYDYRSTHKDRSMHATEHVIVPLEIHVRIKSLCREHKIKTDQIIWRLISNEPKKRTHVRGSPDIS